MADSSRRHSSRAHSIATARPQPALERVGELEQVGDVLGGVAELLGGQRSRVPAGVAGGLADAQTEDRADQVAVAGLGALACEPGGDLRVEDVRDLGSPGAAQDRDVLAPRVQHDLDLRFGEQLGERADVELEVERVDQDRPDAARRFGVFDRDLGQAQQRPIAPLRHELGVDPEPAAGTRERCARGDVPRARQHGV